MKIVKDEDGKVIEFTINRRYWLNGSNAYFGLLCDEFNNKCCLGHYGKACGMPKKELLGKGLYNGINPIPKQMEWLVNENPADTLIVSNLVNANDSLRLKVKEREEKIIELFAKKGIKVIFTG